MQTPRVVKNLLYGTMIVLIGTVILVAVLMAAIQVVDDAPQIPDSWFLAVAVAMGLVAVGTSVRARAERELQRQVDRMQWTHTERALQISTDATLRLAEIEVRTRGLNDIERARASEALEQIEAVRSILTDLRERDLPLLSATQEAHAEASALLALAASTLVDLAATPEQAFEANRDAMACADAGNH